MDIKDFQWWLTKGWIGLDIFLSPLGRSPLFFVSVSWTCSLWKGSGLIKFLILCGQARSPPESQPMSNGVATIWNRVEESLWFTSHWQQIQPISSACYIGKNICWKYRTWITGIGPFFTPLKGILDIPLIEANLKVMMRWYLVPLRLAKLYLSFCPYFLWGFKLLGLMLNIWWDCPRIRGF